MSYPDVIAFGADPFEHFFLYGYKEGRKPNPIFDPIWYVTTYPDVQEADAQPLLHYASVGEPDGRRPSPYFQPAWYREKYGIPESESPLAHYSEESFGPFGRSRSSTRNTTCRPIRTLGPAPIRSSTSSSTATRKAATCRRSSTPSSTSSATSRVRPTKPAAALSGARPRRHLPSPPENEVTIPAD